MNAIQVTYYQQKKNQEPMPFCQSRRIKIFANVLSSM